ncbi:MAG: hypothetical protein IPP69_12095 [Flavobacteriales bacterium]|nr:hypothetical protein [Flavobacteriales bacterium]
MKLNIKESLHKYDVLNLKNDIEAICTDLQKRIADLESKLNVAKYRSKTLLVIRKNIINAIEEINNELLKASGNAQQRNLTIQLNSMENKRIQMDRHIDDLTGNKHYHQLIKLAKLKSEYQVMTKFLLEVEGRYNELET